MSFSDWVMLSVVAVAVISAALKIAYQCGLADGRDLESGKQAERRKRDIHDKLHGNRL